MFKWQVTSIWEKWRKINKGWVERGIWGEWGGREESLESGQKSRDGEGESERRQGGRSCTKTVPRLGTKWTYGRVRSVGRQRGRATHLCEFPSYFQVAGTLVGRVVPRQYPGPSVLVALRAGVHRRQVRCMITSWCLKSSSLLSCTAAVAARKRDGRAYKGGGRGWKKKTSVTCQHHTSGHVTAPSVMPF